MLAEVHRLRHEAYSEGTRANWESAVNIYHQAADDYLFDPRHPTADDLSLYVTILHTRGRKLKTIQHHLNAIERWLEQHQTPFPARQDKDFLETLRGIEKQPAKRLNKKLPISTRQLREIMENNRSSPDHPVINLALLLTFLSFARQSNIAKRFTNAPLDQKVIRFGDFEIDRERREIKFLLRDTKTRSGKDPILFALKEVTDSDLCPIAATKRYLTYLQKLPEADDQFLCFADGRPLVRTHLNNVFKAGIQRLGLDPADFTLHSLRRSAALTAKLADVRQEDINHQGTWKGASAWDYIGPFQYLFSNVSAAWEHD